MPLNDLILGGNQFKSLEPLHGMPLKNLDVHFSPVKDLSPLDGLPLESILLSPRSIEKGMDVLRRMKSLRSIKVDNEPLSTPQNFWKRYDAGEFKK